MNTQHFKYAIEVERTGSITQAADNLYMGQPSLSKAIRELEDTLGIAIFKRTARGMVPTQKGEEFLRYAKNVLEQVQKMEGLRRQDGAGRQVLSIVLAGGSYLCEALENTLAGLDASRSVQVDAAELNAMQAVREIA